jgi:PelA/Pel-15E family pectate lyase
MRTRFLPSAAVIVLVLSPVAAALTANDLKSKPDEWFKSDEGKSQIDSVISWQRPEGGWEKGYDAATPHDPAKPFFVHKPGAGNALIPVKEGEEWLGVGTIDNGLTYTEARVLARAYNLTKQQNVLDAFNRALEFIFKLQYPNGGFAQRFPLADNYGRYITLNDTAMVNVMRLLHEIAHNKDNQFPFVDQATRERCGQSFNRALACLLQLQVVVNGTPTAWAQQYEPQTLEPAKARAYELPGLSGDESAGVLLLLMELEEPSPQVRRAIRAGVEWFERSKVTGLRLVRSPTDTTVVEDPAAEPLWARYCEIDTNRPFFCGRDGIKKYSMMEIEQERRRGYAWLRPWGKPVLAQYAKWAAKHGTSEADRK